MCARDVGGLPGADGLRVGLAEGRTADRMTASYRVRIHRRRDLSAALNLTTDTLDRLRDRVLL